MRFYTLPFFFLSVWVHVCALRIPTVNLMWHVQTFFFWKKNSINSNCSLSPFFPWVQDISCCEQFHHPVPLDGYTTAALSPITLLLLYIAGYWSGRRWPPRLYLHKTSLPPGRLLLFLFCRKSSSAHGPAPMRSNVLGCLFLLLLLSPSPFFYFLLARLLVGSGALSLCTVTLCPLSFSYSHTKRLAFKHLEWKAEQVERLRPSKRPPDPISNKSAWLCVYVHCLSSSPACRNWVERWNIRRRGPSPLPFAPFCVSKYFKRGAKFPAVGDRPVTFLPTAAATREPPTAAAMGGVRLFANW